MRIREIKDELEDACDDDGEDEDDEQRKAAWGIMTRDRIIAVIAGLVGTALALLISRDWVVLTFQSDPLSFCASAILLLLLGVMIGLGVSIVHKKALDLRIGKVAKRTIDEEIIPVPRSSIDKMFEEDLPVERVGKESQ